MIRCKTGDAQSPTPRDLSTTLHYTVLGPSEKIAIVTAAAFARDALPKRGLIGLKTGRRLAYGLADASVGLWDVKSGAKVRRFAGHSSNPWALEFPRMVDTWRLQARTIVCVCGMQSPAAHCGPSWATVIGCPTSPTLPTVVSSPQLLRIAELGHGLQKNNRLLRRFEGHTRAVSDVAFSPDGRHLASASWDKSLRPWEVESGRQLHRLDGHTEWVSAVAFSPDDRRLASGSWETTQSWWIPAPQVDYMVLGARPHAQLQQIRVFGRAEAQV